MIVNRVILAAALAASSAMAHSNMIAPKPRDNVDYAFQSRDDNACENTVTEIPPENNFQRGQAIPVKCKALRLLELSSTHT